MTPRRAESFHALIRGDRHGPMASLARVGLRVLSWPYGLAARGRNAMFDRGWKTIHRAAVPVISVGNLTLGGTGKTPCVEFVAAFCRDVLELRPAILSRGYGVDAGQNDEAMVLEENLPDVPHLQGVDRVMLAATAVEELESEILILDDGFQHRRLHRELDIVLVDATRPVMTEAIFPRGLLREPASGLKRAGVIVLTRCDQVANLDQQCEWLQKRFPNIPVATSCHEPLELKTCEGDSEPLDALRHRPVAAISGIGNPAAFRQTLTALGATPIAERTFADHHAYTRADVEDLERWASTLPAEAMIATTQKDLVKLRLPTLAGRPMRAVRIGFRFLSGEADIAAALKAVVP